MTYFIQLSGQDPYEIDDEIGVSDDLVRRAIAGFVPGAMNANIERVQQGDDVIIKIVKRAGDKGGSPLESLINAPEEPNPAIALSWEMQRLEIEGAFKDQASVIELAKRYPEIEAAAVKGQEFVKEVERSRKSLINAPAIPSQVVPEGF